MNNKTIDDWLMC